MIDATTLGKYIVTKCIDEDTPISNFLLQKILFLIQVESFRRFNEPVFYDDIEAWKFGPVVPNAYYHFCIYGALPILSRYTVNLTDDLLDIQGLSMGSLNIKEITMVNDVVEEKRALPVWDLVEEVGKEGTPWDITYKQNGQKAIIPLELIKKYAKAEETSDLVKWVKTLLGKEN